MRSKENLARQCHQLHCFCASSFCSRLLAWPPCQLTRPKSSPSRGRKNCWIAGAPRGSGQSAVTAFQGTPSTLTRRETTRQPPASASHITRRSNRDPLANMRIFGKLTAHSRLLVALNPTAQNGRANAFAMFWPIRASSSSVTLKTCISTSPCSFLRRGIRVSS